MCTAVLGTAALGTTPAHAALVVAKAPTQSVTCAAGVCTATAPDAVLDIKDLKKLLRHADLTLASGSTAEDIVFAAEFSWTASTPLTSQGTGGVTLISNDGGSGGDFQFAGPGRIAFWDLSSALTINGAGCTLVGDVASLAAAVAANPQSALAASAAPSRCARRGRSTSCPTASGNGPTSRSRCRGASNPMTRSSAN